MKLSQWITESAQPIDPMIAAKDARRQAVLRKWSDLLEGIDGNTRKGARMRHVLAQVCETTLNHMLRPQTFLGEATTTANVGYYAKYVFPALRWAIPNLIANELVSVQPINSAQANVFYLDWVYGTNKGGVEAGQQFPRDFDRNYSSEFINGEPIGIGDAVNYGAAANALSVTLTNHPIRRPSTQRQTFVIIRELDATTGAVVQEAAVTDAGVFTGDVTGAPTLNFSSGNVYQFRFAAIPGSGNPIYAYYHWDSELSNMIPELQLDVKKARVEAGIRKIKSIISAEGAMDLREEHGIEAESELMAIGAQELGLGTDREIIQDLFLASSGTTAMFDRLPPAGIEELAHLRSMLTKLSGLRNAVHKKTLRAGANWMVISPEISALLEQFTTHGDYRPIFAPDMDPTNPLDQARPMTRHGQYPIYKMGTLLGKWAVFVDPFFHRDFVLMGLKGDTYLESGYAYCPYVPLQIMAPWNNPNNLSVVTAMYTRYAKILLRPEFFAQMRVLNL